MSTGVFFAGISECYINYEDISNRIAFMIDTYNIDMFLVGNKSGFDSTVRKVFYDIQDIYPDVLFAVSAEKKEYCLDNLNYIIAEVPKNCDRTDNFQENWMLSQADIIITLKNFYDKRFSGKQIVEL